MCAAIALMKSGGTLLPTCALLVTFPFQFELRDSSVLRPSSSAAYHNAVLGS